MKRYSLLISIASLLVVNAHAQNLRNTFQITPYFNLHGFTWKEFDENGGEALKESGPRYSFGIVSRYSFLQRKNFFTEVDFQYTLGTVDYEGYTFDLQTGARTAYNTKTAYGGLDVSASIGYIAELSKEFLFTPVAGLAYETWNRDIDNGGPLGYDEVYSVFLADVGVNGTFVIAQSAQLFGGVLVRIPLSIAEKIDRVPRQNARFFNIELSPGINPRVVAHLGGSIYGAYAVFYFETWTLTKSPEVQGLHQPESSRTHFGIKLGYTIEFM